MDAALVGAMLESNGSCTHLSLRRACLGAAGGEALAGALGRGAITSLDLSDGGAPRFRHNATATRFRPTRTPCVTAVRRVTAARPPCAHGMNFFLGGGYF